MMRIGVRAHDFGKLPVEELSGRIAARGLSCVQLALSKAIAGIDLKPGQLNPGMAFGRDCDIRFPAEALSPHHAARRRPYNG